jgi:hypothetical protein
MPRLVPAPAVCSFGRVIGNSMKVVEKLEALGSQNGKTKVPIVIKDCGQLS